MPLTRRLRLSVPVLMLLIVVIAVGMGRQVNKANEQRAAVAAVKAHGGWVYFDYEYVDGMYEPGKEPRAPRWLRRIVGDEYFREIREVNMIYGDSDDTRPANDDFRACDDVLACLSCQRGLRSLTLNDSQATDTGLGHLRDLTGLEHVAVLDGRLISDDGVKVLAGLVNLTTLQIDDSRMTDKSLRTLAMLPRLECLYLGGHAFSDDGITALAGSKKLTSLIVGGSREVASRISDRGIAFIKNLRGLEKLDLQYSQISDRALEYLKDLQQLSSLELSGCNVTDEGLAHLLGLDNLKHLALNDTKVTGRGLKPMRQLDELLLDGCDLTDEGLAHLPRFDNLRWLSLSNTKVTDRGLAEIKGLSRLRTLSVHGTRVTAEGKQALKKSMPALTIY